MMRSAFRGAVILILLSWLIGCGQRPAFGPVTGKVTLDGQPLANASIMFRPVIKGGRAAPASYGRTDEGGIYRLSEPISGKSGALVGTHDVVIDVVSESDTDSDAAALRPTKRLPKKYNSETELKFEVVSAATNEASFDLQSQ